MTTFADAEVSVAWLLGGPGLPQPIHPAAPALVWEDSGRTYAELRAGALALAGALRGRGLDCGDRLVTHLFNRGEIFEIYFACAFAGLTLVPASFRATASELADLLREVDARLLVTEDELAGTARQAVASVGSGTELVELDAHGSGEEYAAMLAGEPLAGPFERTDPHVILFSSGTTGKPKGAALTHGNIMCYGMQQVAMYPGYTSAMRTLVVPTTFNTGGLHDVTLPTFVVGGTVCVLPSRRWTPERMAGYIDRWSVTHAVIFPTMFQPLLDADAVSPLPIDSLEVMITGGEICPPDVMRRVRERWPDKELIIGFGSTESGLITFADNACIDRKPGSVGAAAMGQTFKIVKDDGGDTQVGETGEIWTASPTVISGYWNAPELSAAALVDGWLKTGDLGYVDAEGLLYINGRVRDMIISKGQNVYPAEIEAVLIQHPDVRAAAVVGIPDQEFGEAVCAVVVARPGSELSERDVVDFVRDRIASYKAPRCVLFRDSLPVSVNNKVLKRELAGDVQSALARRQQP